mmetsp:Transcript_42649/g.78859  ORF Transcript_42649/g.78859 Transcript_42649/m.78859 type:complete len:83 (-) Transcript_42649:165-413(-)
MNDARVPLNFRESEPIGYHNCLRMGPFIITTHVGRYYLPPSSMSPSFSLLSPPSLFLCNSVLVTNFVPSPKSSSYASPNSDR